MKKSLLSRVTSLILVCALLVVLVQPVAAATHFKTIVVNDAETSLAKTIYVGETLDFDAEIYGENGLIDTSAIPAWSITDTSVARFVYGQPISNSCYVIACDTGVTTLTVSADGYTDHNISITVLSPVFLNTETSPSEILLGKNSETLPEGTVVVSNDNSVVTVSDSGFTLTAVSGGFTTVTVTLPDASTYDVPVYVNAAATVWVIDNYALCGVDVINDTAAFPATAAPSKASTETRTYAFTNWDPEPAKITASNNVVKYTAQFEESVRAYTVQWVLGDSTVSEQYAYNEAPSCKENTAKTATAQYQYTFTGWDIGDGNTIQTSALPKVTSDITIKAVYSTETKKYTVTFEDYDGSILKQTEEAYGTTPTTSGISPSRDSDYSGSNVTHYTFKGWSPSITSVTGNATYTATYSSSTTKSDATSFTITFKNYDGTVLQSGEVTKGTTPTYSGSTPTRPVKNNLRYTFSGWSPEITSVTGNKTYTAKFTTTDANISQLTPEALKTFSTKDPTVIDFTAGTLSLMPTAVKALKDIGSVVEIEVSKNTAKSDNTASVMFYAYPSSVTKTSQINGSSGRKTINSDLGDFILFVPSLNTGNIVQVKEGQSSIYVTEVFSTVTSAGSKVLLHTSSTVKTTKLSSSFTDINASGATKDAIDFAYARGLVTGVTKTNFAPSDKISRAQACTILYRAALLPATKGGKAYDDVNPFEWYARAVFWADSASILPAKTITSFAPNEAISRADQVLMLYKYAVANGMDVSAASRLTSFRDSGEIRTNDQLKAMSWAVASGIIVGDGSNLLPNESTSRADFCVMMERFIEWYISIDLSG